MRAGHLLAIVVVGCLALVVPVNAQTPLGSAFTYQGQLKYEGVAVNDYFDFVFWLYDDSLAGLQVGAPFHADALYVEDGLFTVCSRFRRRIRRRQAVAAG